MSDPLSKVSAMAAVACCHCCSTCEKSGKAALRLARFALGDGTKNAASVADLIGSIQFSLTLFATALNLR
jgi:hypothetical protein